MIFNVNPSTYYFWASLTSLGYGIYAGLRYYSVSGVDLISAKKAKSLISSGNVQYIIDVRTHMEWKAGHYTGAKHIPINKISKNTTKNLDKNKGIITYCNTGQRARAGAERLKALGFKKVFYIDSTYTTLL